MEILEKLAEIEATLSISDPPMAVKEAHAFVPHGRESLSPPAWLNFWEFVEVERRPNDQRVERYTVRPRLYIGPSSANARGSLAKAQVAFHGAFLAALEEHVGLGTSDTFQELRGPGMEPEPLEWSGAYIGLSYEIDVTAFETSANRGA